MLAWRSLSVERTHTAELRPTIREVLAEAGVAQSQGGAGWRAGRRLGDLGNGGFGKVYSWDTETTLARAPGRRGPVGFHRPGPGGAILELLEAGVLARRVRGRLLGRGGRLRRVRRGVGRGRGRVQVDLVRVSRRPRGL